MNDMKKFIVSQFIVVFFAAMVGVGCAQTSRVYYVTAASTPTIGATPQSESQPVLCSSGPTFTLTENGKTVPMVMKWVCMKHQGGCTCTRKYGNTETVSVTQSSSSPATTVAAPTFRWIEQQPEVVQHVVVQPQPIVVQQPVYVEQPVVYQTPRTVYYSSPLISASASIGISSYGGYYPNTYWQENSRCQEYRNIAETRYNYGLGGRNYGGNYGGSYGGGIRPMPPVNYMPGVTGVQLGNYGGGRRH